MLSDDRKYHRVRARLVDELREKGIDDEDVLAAIGRVPRHLFMDQALWQRAYEDAALPIGLSQTISQPFTVAHQTALIAPKKNEKVLEIGTGSGYQAAVLCEMGARVYTIERHRPLYERSRKQLAGMHYRVVCKCGDGTMGWPALAPFDKILVTAGATGIPEPLLQQLRLPKEGEKGGGALVIPVGEGEDKVMKRITRTSEDSFHQEETRVFRFVPLIGTAALRRKG